MIAKEMGGKSRPSCHKARDRTHNGRRRPTGIGRPVLIPTGPLELFVEGRGKAALSLKRPEQLLGRGWSLHADLRAGTWRFIADLHGQLLLPAADRRANFNSGQRQWPPGQLPIVTGINIVAGGGSFARNHVRNPRSTVVLLVTNGEKNHNQWTHQNPYSQENVSRMKLWAVGAAGPSWHRHSPTWCANFVPNGIHGVLLVGKWAHRNRGPVPEGMELEHPDTP